MHGLYYVGQWVVVAMAETEADQQWVPTWWVSSKVTHQSYSGRGHMAYPTAKGAIEAARVEAENVLANLSTTLHRLTPDTSTEK